jgi:hypothetical protein
MPNGDPMGGGTMAGAMDTFSKMTPPAGPAPDAGGDDISALIDGVQAALDALKAATQKTGAPGMGASPMPPKPM